VVSLPRVIKVADVVSILRVNGHNGFPVSLASSLLPFPFLFLFFIFYFSNDLAHF
jgi:hypothetical protein